MKKFFIVFISIILLTGNFIMLAPSADAVESIPLFEAAFGPGRNNSKDNFSAVNCTIVDSPSQPYDPNAANYTSMRVNINKGFIIESVFDNPIDVSDAAYTFISFYLYVTDLNIFKKADSAQLELTSSGQCDVQETAIELNTPSFYNILEEGKWNFIYFYFKNAPGGLDYSNFNYMRFYATGNNIPKATMFLCNFKIKPGDNGGGNIIRNAEVRTWPLTDPDADELVKQEPQRDPIYDVIAPVVDSNAVYETDTDIYLPVPVIEDLANGKFYTSDYKLTITGPNKFTSSESFINVSVPGKYVIAWEAFNPDTKVRIGRGDYTITVTLKSDVTEEEEKDKIPPVMDISNIGGVQILKRMIDLSPKEINDNETDPESLLLVIKVTKPDGVTETLFKRQYAPQMEGKYIVNYYLRDLQGNETEMNAVFTVGDADKTYKTDRWTFLYVGIGVSGAAAIATLIIVVVISKKKIS